MLNIVVNILWKGSIVMMKLSSMMKVVETVDNEWRSPLAEEILSRWHYDEGTVYFFRASANFLFIFQREGKPYFLRFNDSSERDIKVIEAELRIVAYLKEHTLNVVQPVLSRNEKYIEIVETKWGTYHCVVFEGLQGQHYELDELTEVQIYQWGQALGELHATLKNMPDHLLENRPSWKERFKIAKEVIPASELFAHQELERLQSWAERLPLVKENVGLIHYDFELDNVLFEKEKMHMLDFDDSTSHWFIADIIYALRDVGELDSNSPIVREFIRGYKSKTELDENILKEADKFERMHKLNSFAMLIRTVDIIESEDDPEWLLNLRNKLVGYIEEYRQSFEAIEMNIDKD